ncbi:hypothetical protein L1887_54841 [Cichorium endivia]|nr:hypothetical protein L1887_54841 [Cichorium endivia]
MAVGRSAFLMRAFGRILRMSVRAGKDVFVLPLLLGEERDDVASLLKVGHILGPPCEDEELDELPAHVESGAEDLGAFGGGRERGQCLCEVLKRFVAVVCEPLDEGSKGDEVGLFEWEFLLELLEGDGVDGIELLLLALELRRHIAVLNWVVGIIVRWPLVSVAMMDLDGGPGMAVVSDEIGDGRWTPLAFTLCVVAGRLAPCGVDGMQTGRTEMASDVRDRRRQKEGEGIGGGGQGRADETEAAWPELQANAESQEERWMSRSRTELGARR